MHFVVSVTALFLVTLFAWFMARVLGPGFLPGKQILKPFVIILGIFGFCLFSYNLLNIDGKVKRSQLPENGGWPEVDATIVKKTIQGIQQSDGNEQHSKGAILPLVIYEFESEGKTYSGSSHLRAPSFGQRSSLVDVAKKSIAGLGETIKIRYNPEDPSESYVYPAPTWRDYTQMSFGACLFALAVFVLYSIKFTQIKKLQEEKSVEESAA